MPVHAENIVGCTRCLLTNQHTSCISFSKQGLCNYCEAYDAEIQKLGTPEQRTAYLAQKVGEIKRAGKGKPYDCILGLSGGTDSSYMAYWAKQENLRPLVVHLDNGWNSELAVKNIQNICKTLGFELFTHVIDWEEFKELQLAYLRASVVDIEVLTDHAIYAAIFKLAKKFRVRYVLSGYNLSTEAIMPKDWVFDKTDYENIRHIYALCGQGKKIHTFPYVSFRKKLYYSLVLKLEAVKVLNYVDFNKETARQVLIEKLGWRDYGGKHYESVFTKFYQAYILPHKFKIDKRLAHLSSLINSGQISRESATEEMKKELYEKNQLEEEKAFVLKKLGLSGEEFSRIMSAPVQQHRDFKTEENYWKLYFRLIRIFRPWKK